VADNRPEPRNNTRNNCVAGATDRATTRATTAQQPSLKALAQLALSRNTSRNNRATDLLRVARPRECNTQQPGPRAEVEAVLRATCAALCFPYERLRADPTGLRDVDLQELVEGWEDYNRPDLLRAYLRSIAHRLALDRLPAINERAA
jgi:hypothetical protein